MSTFVKTTLKTAKTSIWQSSTAYWEGPLDQLESRTQRAKEWLEQNAPRWLDQWDIGGRAEPHPDNPDEVFAIVEFGFSFLTTLEHGKHDWRETAHQDPKLVAMREMIGRLSNHLDLVEPERFNVNTSGAVYDV